MPETHPDRKKAWDKAMKEDPDWKAFVKKKRAVEKPERLESKEPPHALSAFPGGELGFFTIQLTKAAASQPTEPAASQLTKAAASQRTKTAASQPTKAAASQRTKQTASQPTKAAAS
ncbi:hypothetical protein E8E15_001068 [Penicillium rubens]|nr:hypothetical protein E8E15_001068 [Penicillium rubens]